MSGLCGTHAPRPRTIQHDPGIPEMHLRALDTLARFAVMVMLGEAERFRQPTQRSVNILICDMRQYDICWHGAVPQDDNPSDSMTGAAAVTPIAKNLPRQPHENKLPVIFPARNRQKPGAQWSHEDLRPQKLQFALSVFIRFQPWPNCLFQTNPGAVYREQTQFPPPSKPNQPKHSKALALICVPRRNWLRLGSLCPKIGFQATESAQSRAILSNTK